MLDRGIRVNLSNIYIKPVIGEVVDYLLFFV